MSVNDSTVLAGAPADEIRTRRLVIIDDLGRDRAVIEVTHGHVELRLTTGEADGPWVVLHAGTDEPGSGSAGIEWWHRENAIGASVLIEEDGDVWLDHRSREQRGDVTEAAEES